MSIDLWWETLKDDSKEHRRIIDAQQAMIDALKKELRELRDLVNAHERYLRS